MVDSVYEFSGGLVVAGFYCKRNQKLNALTQYYTKIEPRGSKSRSARNDNTEKVR